MMAAAHSIHGESESKMENRIVTKQRYNPALRFAGRLLVIAGLTLSGCVDRPPERDEIPHIKSQLVELEKFYRGEMSRPVDSLLTQRFYAEMGKRGQWEALTVDGKSWPFSGFANRSFFYTKKLAEVELSFRYHKPDSDIDSLLPAKIRLKKEHGQWLVESVKPVEPLVY